MNPRQLVAVVLLSCIAQQACAAAAPQAPWSFKNNFAIPDSPAYIMLAIEPSDILRPETPRDLGLSASKFLGASGGLVLPRAIAIECSPLLLASPDSLTLVAYKKRKLWYASRLSMATLRDSTTGAPSRVAAGLRITLVDERTMGTDEGYTSELQVTPLTRQILDIKVDALDRARRAAFDEFNADTSRGTPRDTILAHKKQWVLTHDANNVPRTAGEDEELERLGKEIRRRFTERYWNATVLDIAIGARGTSPDSTGRSMRLDALSLWASYGIRAGAASQVVLGLRATSERDSLHGSMRSALSVGSRLFSGSARARLFLECGVALMEEQKARSNIAAGLEAAVGEWAWVTLAASREQLRNTPSVVTTSVRLKTSL